MAAGCATVDGLKPNIVSSINQSLFDDDHYVEAFKLVKEVFEQQASPSNIKIAINEDKRPLSEHARRYNNPVSDEIAVLMPKLMTM